MNEHFFIYNGSLFKEGRPVISSDHPGLLYGDGIFETMRVHHGKIINSSYHFKRLINSLKILDYQFPSGIKSRLNKNLRALIDKYPEEKFLRIRLSVFRSQSYFSAEKSTIDFIIEAFPLTVIHFNSSGLRATIYRSSTKGTGELSNLKNNNYLLNLQATKFARENNKDESILLNSFGRIIETAIANIYFIEGGKIFTPALDEGCVAGTIRSWLMKNVSKINLSINETQCDIDRLLSADEIFITNAIKWIEPISYIENRTYKIEYSKLLFEFISSNLQ